MNDIRERLLAAFRVESAEHLAKIRNLLSGITDGAVTETDLEEIFRRSHSLKGAARAVDLRPVETLAHRLETLFSKIREGVLNLSPESLEVVYQSLDEIEDLVAVFMNGEQPSDLLRSLVALEQILDLQQNPINETTAKKTVFSPPEEGVAPHPPSISVQSMTSVRVSTDHLDRLLRTAGQFLTEIEKQDLFEQQIVAISRQIMDMDRAWKNIRKISSVLGPLTDKPILKRLAGHIDFSGQHLKKLSEAVWALRSHQHKYSGSLSRLGKQLQADVRQARLVPVESVFEGFRKMVRDLARDEGKEVDLKTQGLDLQADRMVLQALKDPLMHLLRNAISHGIEEPEERRRANKPPTGLVFLKISVMGNHLNMIVSDDGRGLNMQAVIQAAIQSGLLTQEQAATMLPQDLAQLICRPGLTTSQFVTELSGRGMGMSVVYEAVMQLQGTVSVQHTDGKGLSVVLSVPLSVATHWFFLLSCCNQRFCFPISSIERLYRVRTSDIQTIEGKQIINIDGKQLPLLSLAHLLDLGTSSVQISGNLMLIVVLKSGERQIALIVDEFHAVREGFIQRLSSSVTKDRRVSGGILLEDGRVSIALNPIALFEAGKGVQTNFLIASEKTEKKQRIPAILVVDDSITTRTLEKSILEAQGYRVLVAVDGVEALLKLRSESVDLVVADVQMPRMDGLMLLQAMKQDHALTRIPIILVTSMDRREDRERGLTLGADAYIIKQKFDQQELLETIKQML